MPDNVLLRTKTSLPAAKAHWIVRERLMRRLEMSMQSKLTSICAPAGFGKTTLINQWIRHNQLNAVWFSLDETDNDVIRLWRHMNQAITAAYPKLRSERLEQLSQKLPSLSITTYLDALLNELFLLDEQVWVILDDYHCITSAAIHESVAYFIDHLPEHVHVMLTSRTEAPFPTAKWLAKGELTELSAEQLTFTKSEAEDFYKYASPLPLTKQQLAKLYERTEGWITALQLITISLHSAEDLEQFINSYSGTNRNIADYLLQEVLFQLPEAISSFLLKTSILSRMDADLCDAVTQSTSSQQMLEKLKAMNLLIVPLDEHRRWYRYHHLFAAFLQSQLIRNNPAEFQLSQLHASEHLASRGLVEEAIDYAFAARNFPLAEALLAQQIPELLQQGDYTTLLRWFESFPENIELGTDMTLQYCFCLLVTGQLDRSETELIPLEEKLLLMEEGEPRHNLQGGILFVRANLLFAGGSYERWLMIAGTLRGDSLPNNPVFYNFNYNTSEPFVRRTRFGLQGKISSDTEMIAHMFSGVLQSAGWGESLINLYVIQSLLEGYYEWNRLDDAIALIPSIDRASRSHSTPGLFIPNRLTQALIYVAAGQNQLAHDTLDEAMEVIQSTPSFAVHTQWLRAIKVCRARIFLSEGRIQQAKTLMAALGLRAQDRPTFDRAYEYITLARLLAAQHKEAAALRLLELLRPQALRENCTMSIVEIIIVQAIIRQRMGSRPLALHHIREALAYAEPNGYIRSFIDEGKPMALLLHNLLSDLTSEDSQQPSVSIAYIEKLLTLFPSEHASSSGTAASIPFIEPLTPGEIQLLECIRRGDTNKRIAQKLLLSEGTVKVYLSRLYNKLGVSSRTQALLAVQEGKLLEAE